MSISQVLEGLGGSRDSRGTPWPDKSHYRRPFAITTRRVTVEHGVSPLERPALAAHVLEELEDLYLVFVGDVGDLQVLV